MAIATEGAELGAAKKKGGKKVFIIAGAAAFIIVAGAGAYFLMFAGKGASVDAHGAPAASAAAPSFIFNLPTMTINLNTDGEGGESFLRLTIALEVADPSVMTQMQPKLAKVIDAFQVYLRELRRSDLEGSAGIYRLKGELLRRVNVAIAPLTVQSILFKEILVQ